MMYLDKLSLVFIFKIAATVLFWCTPLIVIPGETLAALGFPAQQSYMFVKMLGWAYLALCVGYWFGLKAALEGKRLMGPIYVGIVSNGGAFLYLVYYAIAGSWSEWGGFIQFMGWSSIVATALITVGLIRYGVNGDQPIIR
jgi:hypothetical protein